MKNGITMADKAEGVGICRFNSWLSLGLCVALLGISSLAMSDEEHKSDSKIIASGIVKEEKIQEKKPILSTFEKGFVFGLILEESVRWIWRNVH